MKIDTEIRHVTKPGANLFLELGFAPDEAKRLQAASRKQINDTRLLKQQLMDELSVWIAKHHLKQAEEIGRASCRERVLITEGERSIQENTSEVSRNEVQMKNK